MRRKFKTTHAQATCHSGTPGAERGKVTLVALKGY